MGTLPQKMKFFFKDLYSKCDQICKKTADLVIYLLKKFLIENFIFCAVWENCHKTGKYLVIMDEQLQINLYKTFLTNAIIGNISFVTPSNVY